MLPQCTAMLITMIRTACGSVQGQSKALDLELPLKR